MNLFLPVILSNRTRHPLTKAWIDAGGVPTSATVRALDYYFRAVPSTLAPSLHLPLVGNDLTSALIICEGAGTYTVTNNGPFTSGNYSEATGLSGVGNSGTSLDFNVNSPTASPATLGMYVRSIGSHASSQHVWGSRNGADGSAVRFRISNSLNSFLWQPGTGTTTSHTGFLSGTWNGTLVSGTSIGYYRGTQFSSVTASPGSGSTVLRAFAEPAVGTTVWQGVCGGLVWWNRVLSADENATYAAIYDQFQSILGRNV